jgi:hypothetical protein
VERSTLDAMESVDAAAAEIAYRVPLAAAADLVHHEARLLDQQQLPTWLELFTDDAAYWLASRYTAATPDPEDLLLPDHGSLIETYPGSDGSTEEPTTCRIVTDVHPESSEEAWEGAPPCHIVVGSQFAVALVTAEGEQRVIHGWARHGLRRGEDRRLRIAAKRVVVLGGQEPSGTLGFPL